MTGRPGPDGPLRRSAAGAFAIGALLLACAAPRAETQEIPTYDLELRLELEPGRMTGRARVAVPAALVRDGQVRFSVARPGGDHMEVRAVSRPDGVALPFRASGATLTAEVGDEGGGRTLVVEFAFPVDASQLQPFGYYVFGPFGPGAWGYPRLDGTGQGVESFFADYRVTLEHPASLTVLTTGGVGTREERNGRVVARYRADHTQGFAVVAGEGFEVTRDTVGDVPVVAFHDPANAERFRRVIENAGEAAAWYRRTYGFFPLEEVRIFQGHPRWGGGYPLPNLFAVHLGMLEDAFLRYITAHELGHYYWGLHVLGPGGSLDWLQLALGIWADQSYLAERHGRSLPEQFRNGIQEGDWMADYLEAVVRNREQRLGLSPLEQAAQTFDYNSLVRHGKAATGVYLQSLLLGEDRFLELQRRILREYRHRPLPPDEFFALLEREGLEGAAVFFESWMAGDATVGMAVESVEPAGQAGDWRVILARTGTVPYPVEVELRGAMGRTTRHTVAADGSRDTVTVAFRPEAVLLDPDGLIPMWDSSHPEIRAVHARALERARLYEPFVQVARATLDVAPDDHHLRYRLVRRLFLLGRWDEAALVSGGIASCDGRDRCAAALYGIRALARSGRSVDARARLEEVAHGAEAAGLASLLATVRAELEPASGS